MIQGIKNIIKWFPIIWRDRDFDWEFLANIMQFKMQNMSDYFKTADITEDSPQMAKELLICVEALKRMKETNLKCCMQQEKECNELLGHLIGRKMRTWWD